MSETIKTEFSKLRSILWPIHSFELKKFLSMSVIIFCILFNYTMLRNMKDTLVLDSMGAGAITFLKLYFTTPAALLTVIIMTKLFNKFSSEKVFYIAISFFACFYLLFGFVLYPNASSIHPSFAKISMLNAKYPALQNFTNIYGNWIFALFFVSAEIFGSIGLSVLFWQFANKVCKMDEAKRFYGLFITFGNLSLILCGPAAIMLNNGVGSQYFNFKTTWDYAVTMQMTLIVAMCLLSMFVYKYINSVVLKDPRFVNTEAPKVKKKKISLTLGQSFKMIFKSKELLLISLLVVSYGVTVNLVEVQWKNQTKIYFGTDKNALNSFQNTYSAYTGIASILFSWIVGGGLLRKFSWFFRAISTPAIMLIGGLIFFMGIFAKDLLIKMSVNPIAVATFSGMIVVTAIKVVKYGLFDTTKEQAYIPLPDELKTSGKAAVEIIGGRFGKSGGALIQSTLLIIMATSNVLSIAKFSFVFFALMCVFWLYAVKKLSSLVEQNASK